MALHHTIFDLPFAFMGAVLAAKGQPSMHDLIWIALAIIVVGGVLNYVLKKRKKR